jgi:hypothetical protein
MRMIESRNYWKRIGWAVELCGTLALATGQKKK